MNSIKKVTVMGLGYIGFPTAVTFALTGRTVVGIDINPDIVRELSAGHARFSEPGLDDAFKEALDSGRLSFDTAPGESDAYIISVQTPYKEDNGKKVSQLDYVFSAAHMVGKVARPGCLVALESTVPPGTTAQVEEIVAAESGMSPDQFFTAHCPERIIPGNMLAELRHNDRIVGGRTPEAAELAAELYSSLLIEGIIRRTDDCTAEMCKLVENTYRDINIAFANELSIICDKLKVDVFDLIGLANCHPRVNVHTPGVGVGGHCIAVDPWFIHEKFPDETPLIHTARRVNDSKPHWVADRVAADIAPPATIAVLGLSYKAGTDDLRQSPSLELCAMLSVMGYSVVGCEPNVGDSLVHGIENLPLDEALHRADYCVIALGDRVFKENREKIAALPHYDCVGLLR